MALAFSGAFAQTAIPGEDVLNYVSTGTEAAIDVTVGTTVPLYAWPDAYFSPTYDPATGLGINAGHSWAWTPSGAQITLAGNIDNYVELTGATVGGPYTVDVVESGSCGASATTESITVNVLATPTVSITTPAADLTECSGAAALTTAVEITIGANGASNYRVAWNMEIYTMSGSPAVADEWFDTDKTTSLGAAQAYAEEFTQAAPATYAASGAQALLATMPAEFTLIGGKPTVYVITVTAINDAISRKGDFIAIDGGFGSGDVTAPIASDFTYYDVAGVNGGGATDVLTITVNPNPTTGPIYHISNTWAN